MFSGHFHKINAQNCYDVLSEKLSGPIKEEDLKDSKYYLDRLMDHYEDCHEYGRRLNAWYHILFFQILLTLIIIIIVARKSKIANIDCQINNKNAAQQLDTSETMT